MLVIMRTLMMTVTLKLKLKICSFSLSSDDGESSHDVQNIRGYSDDDDDQCSETFHGTG